MRAIYYEQFQGPIGIMDVPDPTPSPSGVVLKVEATGLCRSDWHGWMGHDKDITLPHIPGHELAGTIVELGAQIKNWKVGDRVTLPFVCGCGTCPPCVSGNQQVCDAQFQPGFTHWGSFAEYVAIEYADWNLVALPETISFDTAASLGCRFATAFRAVVDQGKVSGGQWVAVYGCGGVGMSAIMIAKALGAQVIGIDIDDEKLELAKELGASIVINSMKEPNVVEAVKEHSQGGVHVSLDALGHPELCAQSILSLRKRGKHIQVGLLLAEHSHPAIPMAPVVSNELEILGSHGMQAYRYEAMLQMIEHGQLEPSRLIGQKISLEDAAAELPLMNSFIGVGMKIIEV